MNFRTSVSVPPLIVLLALCLFARPRGAVGENIRGLSRSARTKSKGKKSPKEFSERDLLGRFGFAGVSPFPANAMSVGLITFSPNGVCEFTAVVNAETIPNPPVQFTADSCEYQVEPNGLGTILAQDATFGDIPLSFAVMDDADEIRFIRTDAVIGTNVGKRQ